MRTATLLCALALSACASTQHWSKPGASSQDFQRDSYACAHEARQGGIRFGPPWERWSDKDAVNKELYRACMLARGYERGPGGEWVGLRD